MNIIGDTPLPHDPPDGIFAILTAYQQCVRSILSQHDFPGVSAEELELFKRQFCTSAFTCRLKSCPRATMGFDSAQPLREHELSHICRLRCPFSGCHYPPFPSAQALRSHERRVHQPNPAPRPIRRVGNFGQSEFAKLGQHIDKETNRNKKKESMLEKQGEKITHGPGTLMNSSRTQAESLPSSLSSPSILPAFRRSGETARDNPEDVGELFPFDFRRDPQIEGYRPVPISPDELEILNRGVQHQDATMPLPHGQLWKFTSSTSSEPQLADTASRNTVAIPDKDHHTVCAKLMAR